MTYQNPALSIHVFKTWGESHCEAGTACKALYLLTQCPALHWSSQKFKPPLYSNGSGNDRHGAAHTKWVSRRSMHFSECLVMAWRRCRKIASGKDNEFLLELEDTFVFQNALWPVLAPQNLHSLLGYLLTSLFPSRRSPFLSALGSLKFFFKNLNCFIYIV